MYAKLFQSFLDIHQMHLPIEAVIRMHISGCGSQGCQMVFLQKNSDHFLSLMMVFVLKKLCAPLGYLYFSYFL